jgi:hypothetical protein
MGQFDSRTAVGTGGIACFSHPPTQELGHRRG